MWRLNICAFASTSENEALILCFKKWFWKFLKIGKRFSIFIFLPFYLKYFFPTFSAKLEEANPPIWKVGWDRTMFTHWEFQAGKCNIYFIFLGIWSNCCKRNSRRETCKILERAFGFVPFIWELRSIVKKKKSNNHTVETRVEIFRVTKILLVILQQYHWW